MGVGAVWDRAPSELDQGWTKPRATQVGHRPQLPTAVRKVAEFTPVALANRVELAQRRLLAYS